VKKEADASALVVIQKNEVLVVIQKNEVLVVIQKNTGKAFGSGTVHHSGAQARFRHAH